MGYYSELHAELQQYEWTEAPDVEAKREFTFWHWLRHPIAWLQETLNPGGREF